jgi:hypothetical protein
VFVRIILAAALVALALHPHPARAFVPPRADYACPRAALHGTWKGYAHTFNDEEVVSLDSVRSTPGRLEVRVMYSPYASKGTHSTLYEIEKQPTCVGRTAHYDVLNMTWDLELTPNDELTIRTMHPDRGAHLVRLRRVANN